MKFFKNISGKIGGLGQALSRYPVTAFFLLAAAIINAGIIEEGWGDYKYLLTFLVGAFLGFVMQAIAERFFGKRLHHLLLIGFGLIVTLGYFFMIPANEKIDAVTGLRTVVLLLSLGIAYLWLPSIKNKVSFSDSFLIAFKAFFNTLLFSIVLFLGVSLILGAIDFLLFSIPSTLFEHSANIIGIIFAPIYFLSLIPLYPGSGQKNRWQVQQTIDSEGYQKARIIPRFLEILVSYLIIPLLSLYTIILVIYIAINMGGEFWTDNRLEPMLVGFAIAVIVIYILASQLKNSLLVWFKKIAPKVLVLVVLFQIVASILKIQEMGITHGRYYVILFGVFAVISGVIMSLRPVTNVDKNGIIAALFIGFSLFSIIPPLDAFTISRNNQMSRLTATLEENDMLVNQEIIPSPTLAQKDQKIISETVDYLTMMDYQIYYLEEDFDRYEDFYKTFGFYQYIDYPNDQEATYLDLDPQLAIDISSYDTLMTYNVYYEKEDEQEVLIGAFEQTGKQFSLVKEQQPEPGKLLLKNEANQLLMELEMKEVFDYYQTLNKREDLNQREALITPDEATFTQENEQAILSLVARYISINQTSEELFYNGDFYVMIQIKE